MAKVGKNKHLTKSWSLLSQKEFSSPSTIEEEGEETLLKCTEQEGVSAYNSLRKSSGEQPTMFLKYLPIKL